MNTYTNEEVRIASLNYFKGDELASDVWMKKYALKDLNGKYYELTPDDTHHRLAREFARIEKNYPNSLSETEIYEMLKDFKWIVAQGSPTSAVGNPFQVQSAGNCFVVNSPHDSYAGIFYTDQQLGNFMKRRAGVGVDISTLRPRGLTVNNAARSSEGISLFMERYSNTCREVAQGGRRGALMISLRVNHPDIFEFIKIKQDLDKVTGANISIQITDEFMLAAKNDLDFTLQFPVDSPNPIITKTVKAKDIWNELVSASHKFAEPGIMFIDTMNKNSPSHSYGQLDKRFYNKTTNPCFHGDTLVRVIPQCNKDYVDIKIKDLIELYNRGEHFSVLSCEPVRGMIEYMPMVNGLLTKQNAEVLTIHTNISSLTVTPDHEIYVKQNNKFTKIQAKNLKENDIVSFLGTDVKIQSIVYETELVDVYDISVLNNHNLFANGILASNCGEIIMGEDSCRLMFLNLYSYVNEPFTQTAKFNFKKFNKDVRFAQRLMDDLIDIELELISKIIEKVEVDPEPLYIKQYELDMWNSYKETAQLGRRTGLGISGLGDAIAAVGFVYGSDESLQFTNDIYKSLAISSYTESILLAKERGKFPLFDRNIENELTFLNERIGLNLQPEIVEMYNEYGRRNIACNTTAPVGSMSMMTQTTSGVEPVFLPTYKRRRKLMPSEANIAPTFVDGKGDKWIEYNVFHHKFKDWYDLNWYKIDSSLFETKIELEQLSDKQLSMAVKKSPYYKSTSNDINWNDSIKLQGHAQYWIDHSISKTCGLPSNTTKETVEQCLMTAWETECKGITVYVDGSRDGVLISNTKEEELTDRPKELDCDIHHVTANGQKYYVIVGLLNDKPYELFCFSKKHISIPPIKKEGKIIKVKSGTYNLQYNGTVIEDLAEHFENGEENGFTRLVSKMMMRYSVAEICDILDKSWSSVNSFYKVISRTLRKNYITDEELNKVGKKSPCPECGGELVYEEGCMKCPTCGYSRCG